MFMAVALVYLVFPGANPIDAPLAFNSQVTFKDLGQCQAYVNSESAAQAKVKLQQRVLMSYLQKQMAASRDSEDHPVEFETPSVAVTISCVEDHRL